MAAGAWTFTSAGRTSLLNGDFDLDTNTFLMALFLSTSNIGAASTTYAALTNSTPTPTATRLAVSRWRNSNSPARRP